MASSFTRFLDHTQRRTTVGKTPLDEWSARRRDLYLTTHNPHNRQTSMTPVGFEPAISAGERPQTSHLVRAATGTGITSRISATNYNTCFYSKTNQVHQSLKFILLEYHSTCFGRSFSLSSWVKDCTYCNRRMSNRYWRLCKHSAVPVWLMPVAVHTVFITPDDGRKDRPKHVEWYSNKINLRHWCIWLVLLYKFITMHGPMNVKSYHISYNVLYITHLK